MPSLSDVSARTRQTVRQARAEFVRAVRRAYANGATQAQIAAQTGRSQPEVSRLLHFHGTSPLALTLRRHAPQIRHMVAARGGTNVRVFGSVATGDDHAGSDIDLLFTMGTPLSLMQMEALQQQISAVAGAPVDLVPDSVLRPEMRDRIMAEAVLL